MGTHATYQHLGTLEVREYPRDMARQFPELVELEPGDKPLAYVPATPVEVEAAISAVTAKPKAPETTITRENHKEGEVIS